jgi:hypothetical protein
MKSVCTETRTSAQELALAKPLGRGKKLFAKSPGLGVAKKVLLVGIDAADSKPKLLLICLVPTHQHLMMRVLLPEGLQNVPGGLVLQSKFRSLFCQEFF